MSPEPAAPRPPGPPVFGEEVPSPVTVGEAVCLGELSKPQTPGPGEPLHGGGAVGASLGLESAPRKDPSVRVADV